MITIFDGLTPTITVAAAGKIKVREFKRLFGKDALKYLCMQGLLDVDGKFIKYVVIGNNFRYNEHNLPPEDNPEATP